MASEIQTIVCYLDEGSRLEIKGAIEYLKQFMELWADGKININYFFMYKGKESILPLVHPERIERLVAPAKLGE